MVASCDQKLAKLAKRNEKRTTAKHIKTLIYTKPSMFAPAKFRRPRKNQWTYHTSVQPPLNFPTGASNLRLKPPALVRRGHMAIPVTAGSAMECPVRPHWSHAFRSIMTYHDQFPLGLAVHRFAAVVLLWLSASYLVSIDLHLKKTKLLLTESHLKSERHGEMQPLAPRMPWLTDGVSVD